MFDVGQLLDVHATAEQERRVLRKLDLIIIPLMGVCYMMQYMDKLALSQATLFNLRQDLKLEGQQYSWTSAIFYFGYFAWSWPSSYLCVRLPLAKYLSVSIFVWGGVLMCHAAAKNYGGLLAARFFLGVGEAAIAPGFSLIVSMFYRREEQPSRQAAWFAGNCVASIIGGVIAYGIGTAKKGDLASWQLLFLALGAITSGLAIFLIVLLPDSPKSAIFLTKEERVIALHRTLSNRTGVMDTGAFKRDQAWAAIRDPQTWLLVLYTFCVNMCNGGITSFLSVLINGFGFTGLRSLLMQMPIGAAQLVFLGLTITFASWVPNVRIISMIFNTLVGMIGMVLVWKLDEHNQKGRLVGLCLGAVFAINIPFSMSLVSSNVAGFTKRSITSALVFVAYCVGNIIGPQFFLAKQAPAYPTGLIASISGLALGAFFLICLMVYYIFENRRRDSLYGPPTVLTEAEEIVEGLSNKTDLDLESFRYVL